MLARKVAPLLAAASMAVGALTYSAAQGAASVPLSDEEAADLAFMREEEKLARDVYLTFYDTWGIATFSNIASSEQMHTNAILDRKSVV